MASTDEESKTLPPEAMTIISQLQAELVGSKAETAVKVASLEDTITGLAHEIAVLKRRLYGNKTERSVTNEVQLALGDLLANEASLQKELDKKVKEATEAAPPAPKGDGTPRPHGRRNLAASKLPRIVVEIVHEALEAQGCRRVGFEDSYQLAHRPGGFYIVVKRVAKYEVTTSVALAARAEGNALLEPPLMQGDSEAPSSSDDHKTVVTTPSPETLFPKALLHTSTIAHILTSKFALGTPHYRLEQALADQDVPLDRGLMGRYVENAGNTLGATIVAAMWRDAIANGGVISTDATGALIQPTKARDGKSLACKKGHFFTAVIDTHAVLFQYVEKHTSEVVQQLFGAFRGVLQADASAVYNILDRGPPSDIDDSGGTGVTLVGCWAHYLESSVIWTGSAQRAAGASVTAIQRRRLQITKRSQRLEERDQLRRSAPGAVGLAVEPGALPERGEDVPLHLQVGREVSAGGRDARVAEVVPDHGDVDTCLEQRDGAAVAKYVWRYSSAPQPWRRPGRAADVLREDVRDAVASHRRIACAAKDRLIRRLGGLDERPKRCGGLGPDRADAVLVALAAEPRVTRAEQLEISWPHGKGFADASTGVVEEQQ